MRKGLEFVELLCKDALKKGLLEPFERETCPQRVAALIGYEWIWVAQYHAQRLGLVTSGEAGLKLTNSGRRYIDALLELAYMLKGEVEWGAEAVAAALEALTDWRAEFHSGEEMAKYAELVVEELRGLRRFPETYKWACSLMVRYDFKYMESPLGLLKRIEALTLNSERTP
ncbi:MAG: hypothetical protein DRJ96_01960 [Thermoprotei archaeon]|nr:MAG: hypothetical protein DRJ96_01960 [Thermoprotei archaeon]